MSDSYLKSLLGENEEVLFVTHHHWLVLFGEILAEALLALVILVLVTVVWHCIGCPTRRSTRWCRWATCC